MLRSAQMADVSGVQVTEDMFEGKEFCVVNGDEMAPKAELEKLIHRCSGTRVQHPTASTFCVIAASESTMPFVDAVQF